MLLSIIVLPGCAAKVFNEPMAISTRSTVAKYATPIEKVSDNSSSALFIILPIVVDPRDIYDDLLDSAEEKGGNAVTDVQFYDKHFFLWCFPPISFDTWELSGTASRIE